MDPKIRQRLLIYATDIKAELAKLREVLMESERERSAITLECFRLQRENDDLREELLHLMSDAWPGSKYG